MRNDFVTETQLAEVRRRLEKALAGFEEKRGRLDLLNQAAERRQFTATSKSGGVTAVVTGNGRLVDLTIAKRDRRRPETQRLAADLLATIQAARATAASEVSARIDKILPGFVRGLRGELA
jgi:hypothetical protein